MYRYMFMQAYEFIVDRSRMDWQDTSISMATRPQSPSYTYTYKKYMILSWWTRSETNHCQATIPEDSHFLHGKKKNCLVLCRCSTNYISHMYLYVTVAWLPWNLRCTAIPFCPWPQPQP